MQLIISGLQATQLQISLYIKVFYILVLFLGLIPRVGEIGSRDRCTDIDMMPNCFPKGLYF